MKMLLAFILLASCGCDHPDVWEFQVQIPAETEPSRLMEIRSQLFTNGYKRVRIMNVDYGRAIIVYATESEAGDGKKK